MNFNNDLVKFLKYEIIFLSNYNNKNWLRRLNVNLNNILIGTIIKS